MEPRNKTVLVTGASGFVGANLCRHLLAEDTAVHALLNPETRTWRIDDILSDIKTYEVDLCDAERVRRVVHEIRPSIIYHLAAHGAYPFQSDCAQILRVNVFGLWNLLSACKDFGFRLFVNTGSSSEYGRKEFAMRESDPLDPDSFYAVAKATQSFLCRHTALLDGLPVLTVRLFSVYGPYEEPTRLIPSLMAAVHHGQPVKMVSPTTCRDFIHVDDVTDFYCRLVPKPELSGEIVNLGTGTQSSMRSVVETLERVAGVALDARWDTMPGRQWDSTTWVADISKLRRLTGFVPTISLTEGLAKTYRWYCENAALYSGDGVRRC